MHRSDPWHRIGARLAQYQPFTPPTDVNCNPRIMALLELQCFPSLSVQAGTTGISWRHRGRQLSPLMTTGRRRRQAPLHCAQRSRSRCAAAADETAPPPPSIPLHTHPTVLRRTSWEAAQGRAISQSVSRASIHLCTLHQCPPPPPLAPADERLRTGRAAILRHDRRHGRGGGWLESPLLLSPLFVKRSCYLFPHSS